LSGSSIAAIQEPPRVITPFSLSKDVKFDSESPGYGTGNTAEVGAANNLAEKLNDVILSSAPDGAPGDLRPRARQWPVST
jgi:hypothetical protein